jgi:hypothetical protein
MAVSVSRVGVCRSHSPGLCPHVIFTLIFAAELDLKGLWLCARGFIAIGHARLCQNRACVQPHWCLCHSPKREASVRSAHGGYACCAP